MEAVADTAGIAQYLSGNGRSSTNDDVIRYLRSIVTLRARGGKIIEISVTHKNPNMAKKIADTIADTYKDKTLRWRQEATSASTDFIDQELEKYSRQLTSAEEALAEAQKKGVLDSLSGGDSSLIREFAKFRADLVEVELDLREANGELQNARRLSVGSVAESYSPGFYTDPEIIRLQTDLAGLQAQYTELSMKYTDAYPGIKKLNEEILQTKKELEQAKGKFSTRQKDIALQLRYWADKVRSLEVKRTALNDQISEYDRVLQRLPQRQLELARLQRDKAAAENTYSMLLQRRNEADLLQSSESREMSAIAEILDYAIAPDRPIKPNKKKIAFLAVAMGIAIGCGMAFLLEYFDRSFRTVDEVADYLQIPVLAAIPRLTTSESEARERRNRFAKIACMAFISLLVLVLIADIVSAELLARDSLTLNIARIGFNLLRVLVPF